MARLSLFCYLLFFFVANFHAIIGQRSADEPIEIIGADHYKFDNRDNQNIKTLSGSVRIRQGGIYFFCDSLIQYTRLEYMEMFDNVRINYEDSTTIYADYIKYFSKKKYAHMRDNVKVLKKGSVLRTSKAYFDLDKNFFRYFEQGVFEKNKRTLTSRRGIYYGQSGSASFYDDVHLHDSVTDLRSDSLNYDASLDRLILISPTRIKRQGKFVIAEKGYLGNQPTSSFLYDRPYIYDSTFYAVADSIFYNGEDSIAVLVGNALLYDSVNRIQLTADSMISDNQLKSFKAMHDPVAYVLRSSEDTLVLRADTIYSILYTNDSSAAHAYRPRRLGAVDSFELDVKDRYLSCYDKVRFYSDSLQGFCDEVYFSTHDSILRMIDNPVLWVKDYQMSGDTIYIHMENKKADYLHIPSNTFIAYQEYDSLYSQARSKSLTYFFDELAGQDSAFLYKNVKMSYFVKDSLDAFISFDVISANDAIIRMKQKKMERINFVENYKSAHYPPDEIPIELLYLNDYVNYDTIRPPSREFIVSYYKTLMIQQQKDSTLSVNQEDSVRLKKPANDLDSIPSSRKIQDIAIDSGHILKLREKL